MHKLIPCGKSLLSSPSSITKALQGVIAPDLVASFSVFSARQ
jgi:hypothetical protein